MNITEKENRYLETINKHIANGVIFFTSHGVVIDEDVVIGIGTVIYPGTILLSGTVVGSGCTIGPNSMLKNCKVGDGVTFNSSQGTDSVIDDGATVGPFSQLRPGSHICRKVKIGDFVEIKNSVIGEGTSVAHLTYVGDSDVGRHVNFGCGVVTVNYDGQTKNRTKIGDYAFIGCNTNLIAPVEVGDGAYTAAGSTITKDVPAASLAVARSRQTNIDGWAKEKLSGYIKKHSNQE